MFLSGKFCDFEGNFVNLREKIRKYLREICYSRGKFCSTCREIHIFQACPVWFIAHITLTEGKHEFQSCNIHDTMIYYRCIVKGDYIGEIQCEIILQS